MPNFINLPPFTESGDVHVVVETPRGSRAKFAYDPKLEKRSALRRPGFRTFHGRAGWARCRPPNSEFTSALNLRCRRRETVDDFDCFCGRVRRLGGSLPAREIRRCPKAVAANIAKLLGPVDAASTSIPEEPNAKL